MLLLKAGHGARKCGKVKGYHKHALLRALCELISSQRHEKKKVGAHGLLWWSGRCGVTGNWRLAYHRTEML